MAQAEQPVNRRADPFEFAAQAQCLERADALRLDQQPRAHGRQLRMFLENADIVALSGKGDGGSQAGIAGAGDADGQWVESGHGSASESHRHDSDAPHSTVSRGSVATGIEAPIDPVNAERDVPARVIFLVLPDDRAIPWRCPRPRHAWRAGMVTWRLHPRFCPEIVTGAPSVFLLTAQGTHFSAWANDFAVLLLSRVPGFRDTDTAKLEVNPDTPWRPCTISSCVGVAPACCLRCQDVLRERPCQRSTIFPGTGPRRLSGRG